MNAQVALCGFKTRKVKCRLKGAKGAKKGKLLEAINSASPDICTEPDAGRVGSVWHHACGSCTAAAVAAPSLQLAPARLEARHCKTGGKMRSPKAADAPMAAESGTPRLATSTCLAPSGPRRR